MDFFRFKYKISLIYKSNIFKYFLFESLEIKETNSIKFLILNL
jgi:hypothetical protein